MVFCFYLKVFHYIKGGICYICHPLTLPLCPDRCIRSTALKIKLLAHSVGEHKITAMVYVANKTHSELSVGETLGKWQ